MKGKLIFVAALVAILLFGCTQQVKTNEKTPGNSSPANNTLASNGSITERTVPANSNWKYVLFLPPNYNASRGYPLIVGLHGSPGSAEDYVNLLKDEAGKNGFILAFPQSPDAQGWDTRTVNEFVIAVVDDVNANHNITNMYLTGHSAGARMIVTIALLNPIFRGVLMVDGALPPVYCPPDIIYCEGKYTSRYGLCMCSQGQYFYMLNGENDSIITKSEAMDAKAALEKCGVNVTQRFLPNHGHDYPEDENQNIIGWFANLESNKSIPADLIKCKPTS